MLAPLFAAALVRLSPYAPAATVLRAGLYEELMLAVAPDGRVTGRYYEERGRQPHFDCEFLFSGRIGAGGRVAGVTWADDQVNPAPLAPAGAGVSFAAPGSSQYPGCGMTIGPMAETPQELDPTRKGAWTTLLRVHGARVNLRPGPAEAPSGRAHVVDDDVVGLLARRPGWLQVEYVADADRASRGWIRSGEATPVTPPTRRGAGAPHGR